MPSRLQVIASNIYVPCTQYNTRNQIYTEDHVAIQVAVKLWTSKSTRPFLTILSDIETLALVTILPFQIVLLHGQLKFYKN
jgi:hypothetical protein